MDKCQVGFLYRGISKKIDNKKIWLESQTFDLIL